MNQILPLVATTALLAISAGPACAETVAAEPPQLSSTTGSGEDGALTGRQAIERVVGNTMVATPPGDQTGRNKAVIYLRADGTAVIREVGRRNPAEAMIWIIGDEGRLCLYEPNETPRPTGSECVDVSVQGDRITMIKDTNNRLDMDVRLVPGNPYGV